MYNVKHKSKLCAKNLGFRTSEDTPIFVSDQLTPKGARLYFLARELVKTKAYRFWLTAFGKIHVRKDENSPIITIKDEAQISYLLRGA
ncbi:jg17647 [Pararge aegeria aegeria]|uniref:Jg17647 protein n=1 Tax=Pararge aegeria aegeria TaxID=348720 RepID=A0A8S4RFR7_9NEOP|nr:jg17647 [Pararge aegeria aegeria]